MKVTVTLELDVRPADWIAEYGTAPLKVPTDVRDYVLNTIQQTAGAEAAFDSVTLKG